MRRNGSLVEEDGGQKNEARGVFIPTLTSLCELDGMWSGINGGERERENQNFPPRCSHPGNAFMKTGANFGHRPFSHSWGRIFELSIVDTII